MAQLSTADLVERILAVPSGSPRLIGIDGPAGSGKSTVSRRLLQYLSATLIQMDDFVSWPDFADWWPRLDREVLTPLLLGTDAHYQVRDWTDEFGTSLGPWKTARAADVIVMEGVTCTRKAVADRLTFSIWVEAPAPVRLARGLERDGEDHRHLWEGWMVEEERFFADDDTRARADLRLTTAGTSTEGDFEIAP